MPLAAATRHGPYEILAPMTRLILALTLMLAFPREGFAQLALPTSILPEAVRFHLGSWHDRGGYDNANLGVALRWKSRLVVGGFNNSYSRPSCYGGLVVPAFEKGAVRLELMAGVISGYSDVSPVDLVAVPSLGWRLSPRSSLQVVLMPRVMISANAVHLMYERRLGDGAGR